MNPESIPHKEHIPGAVKFKEAEDTKELFQNSNCDIDYCDGHHGDFCNHENGQIYF